VEHTFYRPFGTDRAPRNNSVDLEDLQDLNSPLVAREITPPSEAYIEQLWQREYAMTALRGIQANIKPGLHRRQETFAEIARDEITSRWRRARRFMGDIAMRMMDHIAPAPRDSYAGSLDDVLGTPDYEYNVHEAMGALPEAPISPAIIVNERQPEDEWLNPLAASSYFSDEELESMRRAVAATHPPRPRGTLYRSEYAANSGE
jgi:hypothetical protein